MTRDKEMLCPLFGIVYPKCNRAQCGWWDYEDGQCAILTIAGVGEEEIDIPDSQLDDHIL